MKAKWISLFLMVLILTPSGVSQVKSRKELKQVQRIANEKSIAALIDTKRFLFVASTAFPQGGGAVNLITNPGYVVFLPDTIIGDLPFFGRAFTGGYDIDAGLKFMGAPTEFTVSLRGNKGYLIKVVVNDLKDYYRLTLDVDSEGGAKLGVNCNSKSYISYLGEIRARSKK